MISLSCAFLAKPGLAQTASCTDSDTAVTAVITDSNDTAGRTALAGDCAILLDVKDTLLGTAPDKGSLNWAANLSMASWDGITVTGSRVTTLAVNDGDLTGTFPDLSGLSSLAIIELVTNRLSGPLVGSHFPASLEDIQLNYNEFTGTIPDLSGLSGLLYLAISNNRLSGTIDPAHIPTSVDILALQDNRFTAIPDLGGRSSLRNLYLQRNRLAGSIPDFSTSGLLYLLLGDNDLSGALDASHFPTSLIYLQVQRNQFSGPIPNLGSLTNLTLLYLHQNRFSGSIPTTLGSLTALERLHLVGNPLTGGIPSQLGSLTSLAHLSLCGTDLDASASLPSALETRRTGGQMTVYSCLSIADAEAREGADLSFTVTYDTYPVKGSSSASDLTLSYRTDDVTATDGDDYTGTTSGSVTVPGNTSTTSSSSSATITVPTLTDGVSEGAETLSVSFTGRPPSGAIGLKAWATGTITEPPPPSVSVHPADSIGLKGISNSASVELRLSRALESGETLAVTYSLDLNAGASESDNGVTLTHNAGDPSTGTLTIAGPNAPQSIALQLSPANNTVDRSASGSRAADFRLTGVSGVDGASLSGVASAKIFVNDSDSRVDRHTAIQVSGGSRLGRRQFEEGSEVWILLDGKAGKKRNAGLRTHDWYNVVIGVQHLTTDFDDLGAAYAGDDALVGDPRRDGDTDYYNVGVLGYGPSAQVRIPISDDATSEGDERFRVFIAETPGNITRGGVIPNNGVRASYMGVRGTYNSLDAAPGVDFTIKGQAGGGQRAPEQQAPPSPPAPTQAVSNLRVTAVDANNAKVAWDAVEHATSYEVEYETTSALTDADNYVQGAAFDWTDTEWTFRHDAAEAMTLTVTVTPAYEDENGDTQLLDDLAGTATIDVGPAGTGSSDSISNGGSTDNGQDDGGADYSELKATVRGYADETQHGDDHVNRWKRALAGLGDGDAIAEGYKPMTADEAQDMADTYSASRWDPVVEALTDLESRQTAEPEPEPDPVAEPEPQPDPVTIGACVSVSQWDTVAGYYGRNATRSPNYGANWYRVLIAYHEDRSDQTMPDWVGSTPKPSSAFTVADAEDEEETWAGWTPIRKVLQCLDKESGQSFVPLLPGSSNPAYGGVVRFVNPSPQGGYVSIQATDDSGWSPDPVTLYVGPGQSIDLTTRDLEQGNAAKGLAGNLGWGTGEWRLDISIEPDASGRPGIEALPYVRAHDGRLAPMHGIAEVEQGVHHVPTFTPADGAANDPSGRPTGRRNQAGLHQSGLLRLINRGDEALAASITGTDDSGRRSGEVSVDIPARESVLLTAAELEGGGAGLRGALGDGRGMWRLNIASGGDLAVMSLQSSDGHLTNLSNNASPASRSSGVQAVPYFPSASDSQGRQGVIRIINESAFDAPVRVQPYDSTGRRYEPLTLVVRAGEAVHLDSWDLELGDPSSGLSGSTGAGMGDWRLEIASEPGVEVLAYVRSLNGALAPVRDIADEDGQSHEAAR